MSRGRVNLTTLLSRALVPRRSSPSTHSTMCMLSKLRLDNNRKSGGQRDIRVLNLQCDGRHIVTRLKEQCTRISPRSKNGGFSPHSPGDASITGLTLTLTQL